VVNTAARCTFFLLNDWFLLLSFLLDDWFLLVVILSAERLVSAGRTMVLLVVILSAGRFVSADRVHVPAVCMVSAVACLFLLAAYIHAAGVVYAANTSIHAAGLGCAGSIMFLLLLPHVYREDLLLLRRRMNRYFRLNPDVDVGLDLWRDVNLLCQSLHSDDVEDFWRTQDEWVVSSWKLYPKSSVHVLDLTNGKTVYMFVDKVYPIRATLLERMLRHRLTVPPSYFRDVVVAGSVIQTVQAGLRESYECLASVPM
ncbi:hypothetical protein Tco_1140712, partial [Tanacetum coccineum]